MLSQELEGTFQGDEFGSAFYSWSFIPLMLNSQASESDA